MIQPERITVLNAAAPAPAAPFCLYWMQAAQRAEYNHALEYAIKKANDFKKPLLVYFGLTPDYPAANLRHYRFMLQGLARLPADLAKKGIKMLVRVASPEKGAAQLARSACVVVTDAGHTRTQRAWRDYVADHIQCTLFEVETNLIVPPDRAAAKEQFSAGTFRPRITARLDYYLKPLRHARPKKQSLGLDIDCLDLSDIDKTLAQLGVDRSVGPAASFTGGTAEAKKRLTKFIRNKLDDYDRLRNDPCEDALSNMSPYLHFGQISPLYIALKIRDADKKGKPAYLEQLIVRRELAANFVYYNRRYDSYPCLPPWAKRTLEFHKPDKRPALYSLEQLENADTHDPCWNAAQKEMMLTGKMHGYMRMYWGKKILEWSRSPARAFKTAVYLNDKYELDGRDPNGYAGIAWCFGKHDRPWPERPVFGKVRYMNLSGLKRKFKIDKYIRRIQSLEKSETR